MLALKFLLSVALLAASAVGQYLTINSPASGTTVAPGSNITVQLGSGDGPTTVVEVAVVIGVLSCGGNCVSTNEDIGQVLYQGPFNPQPDPGTATFDEDFPVQIPASIAAGEAQLVVALFSLTGAYLYPQLEVLNQNITIS
ncbi:hypothetical protein BV22DRAFT_1029253 [Leucogyrophana mollusca]|uniref:Uncharacterized protein n=1 Tax=Leucogyrophana mollusca TaxID=85980 RepID=A0ACB8BX33_9AGAM|nr:hypothetical protein BV22DRAFT_1029253 [Leucogyrophana mollusca]